MVQWIVLYQVKFTNFHKYHCIQDVETGGNWELFLQHFINLKLFQDKKLIFFLRILNGGTKIDLDFRNLGANPSHFERKIPPGSSVNLLSHFIPLIITVLLYIYLGPYDQDSFHSQWNQNAWMTTIQSFIFLS